MDGTGNQKESRDRTVPRSPSGASMASTTNTQVTHKSGSSSSSHPRETAHGSPHAAHKYHHAQCGKSSSNRPASRLSRQHSEEPQPRTAVPSPSSFLQEQIQRQRKAVGAKVLGKSSGDLSASSEHGDRDSPVRGSTNERTRNARSEGSHETLKEDGMGMKQMEKTISTLHKQNFDLKLELFHRRERQSALEERIERLEEAQREQNEMHSQLIATMEMKDKAVLEAVQVIVELETKVANLVMEKEKVKLVETDGQYRHSSPDVEYIEPDMVETPKGRTFSGSHLSGDDAKSLDRMPSFLSEHSEHTENLRNVVLGRSQSSLMHHTRNISASSADPSEIHRFTSPSLSILSESSFLSIYGAKDERDSQDKMGLPPAEDIGGLDGSPADRSPTPTKKTSQESWGSLKKGTSGRPTAGHSQGARPAPSSQMQSLNHVLDRGSPLQKLERFDKQSSSGEDVSRPSTSSQGRGANTPTRVRTGRAPSQVRNKQEKRDALQKVLTNYPNTYKDLATSHTLPPTPDTVSSSILRKHQTRTSSQDSLGKYRGPLPGDNPLRMSDDSGTFGDNNYKPSYSLGTQPPSFSAYPPRRNIPMPTINMDLFSNLADLAHSLPPRPHSASETTYSRPRADSFVSDSDSDGGVNARYAMEDYDPWMRERMKPDDRCNPGSSASQGPKRSGSPDLFSFPAVSGGWESDVIFGALKGSGFLGSPVSALKRDPLDEMTSSLQQTSPAGILDASLEGSGPAPPSRRSSLHARTGSTSAMPPPLSGKLRKIPPSGAGNPSYGMTDGRGRSNSIDSAAQVAPPTRASTETGNNGGRRNHYPPIAGKTRGLGLNALFRRSGSESFSSGSGPQSATEPTFPPGNPLNQHPVQQQQQSRPLSVNNTGRSSVPPPASMPWALRPPPPLLAPAASATAATTQDSDEQSRMSATPPPIMRKRAPTVSGSENLTDAATSHQNEAGAPSTPTAAAAAIIPSTTTIIEATNNNNNNTPPGKRRWLGLGSRIGGSMKTRTG
ncbi:hypothetical protein F4778DRAFT_786773 [Xylariomycetidae sp. FL2044]|nr:hypothetical protein F4778DRAFT_786773 [Xylariomycetidae sp. FL2044]